MNSEATLLDALRAVPGVSAADIEPDDRSDGAGTLRLQLAPGADEIAVATSVNRVLREQFGLAVDANRVQVVEESVPTVADATAPAEPVVDSPLATPPINDPRVNAADDFASGEFAPNDAGRGDVEFADQGVSGGRPTLTAVPGYRDQPESKVFISATSTSEDIDDSEQPQLRPIRGSRILIQKMQLVSAGLGVTTQVTLSWRNETFPGEASAAATPTSVHRSVAQATLRAVEGVVTGKARFELEQLELNQLGPDRAVVVVVSMLTRVGSERLTGVSVIREDVRQAVIRATLDALNRRLESLLLSA